MYASYRQGNLSDLIPLETPAVLAIEASSRCCFNCKYCYHSFLKLTDRFESDLSYNTFKKIVKDSYDFQEKIDTLVFARFGEPLMNNSLGSMISLAKESQRFNRIKVISNGFLIDKEKARELVNAGIDILEISIQADTEAKYEMITGVSVNPNIILDNIDYIANMNNRPAIVVKVFNGNLYFPHLIMDKINKIADNIIVENIIDLENEGRTYIEKYGRNTKICSQAFFTINIDAMGNIIPCCGDVRGALSMGNVNHISLYDFWNGNELYLFQMNQLQGSTHRVCCKCNGARIYTPAGCDIDSKRKYLIDLMERR